MEDIVDDIRAYSIEGSECNYPGKLSHSAASSTRAARDRLLASCCHREPPLLRNGERSDPLELRMQPE